MDDSNNDGDGGGCLSQNFVMKYIYYWMETEPPCCRCRRPRRSGAVPTLADAIGAASALLALPWLVGLAWTALHPIASVMAQPQSVGGGSFGNKGKILEGIPI